MDLITYAPRQLPAEAASSCATCRYFEQQRCRRSQAAIHQPQRQTCGAWELTPDRRADQALYRQLASTDRRAA